MSYLKQLAGETALYGAGYVLPRIVQFIFNVFYFTRILPRAEYGSQGIIYGFGALLLIVCTLRMETAFFRFGADLADRPRAYHSAWSLVGVATLILIGALCMYSDSAAELVTEGGQGKYLRLMGIIIGLDALSSLAYARLRLEQRARLYAQLRILNTVLHIVLLVFLIEGLPLLYHLGGPVGASWLDKQYYLDYIFWANLLASLCILLYLCWIYPPRLQQVDRNMISTLWRYGWPLIPVGLAGIINLYGDQYFIKSWVPSADGSANLEAAGLYGAVKRLAMIMIIFTTAYNYALEPFLFRTMNHSDARTMYARTAEAFTAVSTLLIAGVLLFQDFFMLWIGPEYRSAQPILPIALLAFYFLGLYYNLSAWYKLADKTYAGAIIAVLGVIVTVLLSYYLLPRIGIIGSAWTALACFVSMCVLCTLWGRSIYLIPYRWSIVLEHVLIMIGVILLTQHIQRVYDQSISMILIQGALFLGVSAILYLRNKDRFALTTT